MIESQTDLCFIFNVEFWIYIYLFNEFALFYFTDN